VVWSSRLAGTFTPQIYLDADLALKEEALAKTNPVKGAPKRYRPDDELLAFLKQL
jgi:hypothetical protein